MSNRGYANWGPSGMWEGSDGSSSSSDDDEFSDDEEDPAEGMINQNEDDLTDMEEESRPVPTTAAAETTATPSATGDEFEDTMNMFAAMHAAHADTPVPAAADSEAQRYLDKQRAWSEQREAAKFERNIFKEKGREAQRALGALPNPRAMKLYPTIPAPRGSFTDALLTILGTDVRGGDTLQSGLGRTRFPQLFSAQRFRTDAQDCSIYTMEKAGSHVRQLVDNETVDTNVYYPREGEGLLGSGEHLVVLEYDLRALAAASTLDESAKYYGLFKSSFLHKPAGTEQPSHIESVPILLSFGRLPGIMVKPQIAGDLIESSGTREQVEDRIWYSAGSGGGEAAFTRTESLVIFRFGKGETPMEQRLIFVYLVMSQSDAVTGLGSLIDAVYPKGGRAPAAASAALHAISLMPIANNEQRVQIARAAHHLSCLFAEKVPVATSKLEAGHLHTIPVASSMAPPKKVQEFTRRFQAFFVALGQATTKEEANAVLFAGQAAKERDRFDSFHKSNFNASATFLSQMIFALQHRMTPIDAVSRLADLWDYGHEALDHFAPSPALLSKMAKLVTSAPLTKPVASAPLTKSAIIGTVTPTSVAAASPKSAPPSIGERAAVQKSPVEEESF